jgi:hypothetical protein
MKALSVKQPWAGLIASGRKTIEVRTWPTRHRGDLLIVASLRPPTPQSGKALCIARVVDCRPMTMSDEQAACCRSEPGVWAWVLADIRQLEAPFAVQGRLSIYEVTLPEGLALRSS